MALKLIPLTEQLLHLFKKEPLEQAKAVCANASAVAQDLKEVALVTLQLAERKGYDEPWICYLAQEEESEEVVGTCGFNGGPQDGTVEIAYYTFKPYEKRGHGSRMAQMIATLALIDPAVKTAVAHTLPSPNASTRILEKAGFTRTGEVQHPEDGPVWRWEKKK